MVCQSHSVLAVLPCSLGPGRPNIAAAAAVARLQHVPSGSHTCRSATPESAGAACAHSGDGVARLSLTGASSARLAACALQLPQQLGVKPPLCLRHRSNAGGTSAVVGNLTGSLQAG